MNLLLNTKLAESLISKVQKARVMTEDWFLHHMFCPRCGNRNLCSFENNRPVADFYCEQCNSEYELKSKANRFSTQIAAGAYHRMIERITSNNNPDLFCLTYTPQFTVKSLILILKHFFVPEIIKERKALALTAKRAGWVGCNILINKVPEQGKIVIINNGIVQDINRIVTKTQKSSALFTTNLSTRSWLIDTLTCINRIQSPVFSLSDIYSFEEELSFKHPDNKNIQAKIRQQLQYLRDKGYIEFLGKGSYKKII